MLLASELRSSGEVARREAEAEADKRVEQTKKAMAAEVEQLQTDLQRATTAAKHKEEALLADIAVRLCWGVT